MLLATVPVYGHAVAKGFRVKHGPPSGFSASELNVQQHTYVSLYFLGNFIGNYQAVFDDDTLKFDHPDEVYKALLPYLKNDSTSVATFLKVKQANNNALVCADKNKPFCQPPKQIKTAALVLDSSEYRVGLFVAPQFVKPAREREHKLPNSNAGFSIISQNQLSATDTTDTSTASLNNTTLLGYGNNSFSQRWNVTRNTTKAVDGEDGTSNSTVSFQQADIARYHGGVLYQTGMLTPNTGNFISGQQMLGFDMRNYGISPFASQEVAGTPTEVYLPVASKVAVYRNNILISSQSFTAGKHFLDTSTFPSGSYNIQLRISANTGKTTTENRFFVKDVNIPQHGSPNFDFAMGILQDNVGVVSESSFYYPRFTDVPYLNYYEQRFISNHWSLGDNLTTNFNRVYASGTLNYVNNDLSFGPGALVSNNRRFGSMMKLTYTGINDFTFNYQITKYFGGVSSGLQGENDNIRGSNFLPLSLVDLTSGLTVGYSYGDINATAGYLYTKTDDNILKQFNFTLFNTLYQSQSTTVMLSGQMTRAEGNNVITLGVTANFFNPVVNASVGMGLNNQTPTINEDGSESYNNYQKEYNLGMSKQISWGVRNQLAISANASHTEQQQIANLQMQYQSNLANGSASFSYNKFNDSADGKATNHQYTLDLSSNLVYADGKMSFGYSQGLLSGVMVDVESDADADVVVYANGQPVGIAHTNWPTAIFLSPYQTYRLTIEPNGLTNFTFDHNPKVVTIYTGNVKDVTWQLAKKIILFAKVVDKDGKPLPNLLLVSRNEFDTTDETGYIQAGITSAQRHVQFRSIDGDRCSILLPKKLNVKEGLAVLSKPLVCDLQQTKSTDDNKGTS